MKIIAFGASHSKNSINKSFAKFVADHLASQEEVEVLDLNDFPVPVFTIDEEQTSGHPENAKRFVEKIEEADLLAISMAEHNGAYTASFKNLFDWSTRVKLKLFEDKKIFLVSTAPGPRGGISSLEIAAERFPRHGAEIVETFSLPKFKETFDVEKGIIDEDLKLQFEEKLKAVRAKM